MALHYNGLRTFYYKFSGLSWRVWSRNIKPEGKASDLDGNEERFGVFWLGGWQYRAVFDQGVRSTTPKI